MFNCITKPNQSQAEIKILQELETRKKYHTEFLASIVGAFKKCDHYTEDKDERIRNCASYIAINEKGDITGANFCKNRYCPICQWRLSRKTYGQMFKAQQQVESTNKDLEFIFLTLTITNMKCLSDGISHILAAFNNFIHDRAIKKINKGFIRTLEIAWSQKHRNWHPHIHTIIAVHKDYFSGEDYKKITDWMGLWKRAARIDYNPQIKVEKIKGDKASAIAEISKYMVKPIDLSNVKTPLEPIYIELLQATYKRRLRSYGGVYREALKAINATDDIELTDIEFKPTDHEYKYTKDGYRRIVTILANGETGEITDIN